MLLKRRMLRCLLSLFLCISFTACNITIDTNSTTTPQVQGTGVRGVQVFVEPDAGEIIITNAIQAAKKSILLEVYLLTDKTVMHSLEEATHRGLDVRVMLEEHPYGGGSVSPQQTLDMLKAAGVKAQGANPQYSLNHIKTMVIDGQIAYIMTCNLTLAALGKSKYQENREYGIIDANPKDVQDIQTILEADWNRITPAYTNPDLVVSPNNSRASLTGLIDGARKTLVIEAEIMQDTEIAQHLANAEKRGVQVQVILPKKQSTEATGDSNQDTQELAILKESSVSIHESTKLYMHAKMMIVDKQKAYVGSINFSAASMERNRELGIIVADSRVLNILQQKFQEDWKNSQVI